MKRFLNSFLLLSATALALTSFNSLFAMEQGEPEQSEKKALDEVLSLEMWAKVAEFLSGNDRALINYLAPRIPLSKKTCKNISREYLKLHEWVYVSPANSRCILKLKREFDADPKQQQQQNPQTIVAQHYLFFPCDEQDIELILKSARLNLGVNTNLFTQALKKVALKNTSIPWLVNESRQLASNFINELQSVVPISEPLQEWALQYGCLQFDVCHFMQLFTDQIINNRSGQWGLLLQGSLPQILKQCEAFSNKKLQLLEHMLRKYAKRAEIMDRDFEQYNLTPQMTYHYIVVVSKAGNLPLAQELLPQLIAHIQKTLASRENK